MIIRKPQTLDTYYYAGFFRNLWKQSPIADSVCFRDSVYTASNFFNVEAYKFNDSLNIINHTIGSQQFLFFYPSLDWLQYTSATYEYKGNITSNLKDDNILKIATSTPEETTSELSTYKKALQSSLTIAAGAKIQLGTEGELRQIEEKLGEIEVARVDLNQTSLYEIRLGGVGESFAEFTLNDKVVEISPDNKLITRVGAIVLGDVEVF